MNIKWIGAVLIILGCGGAGFSFSIAYRREEQLLQQLLAALDYMSCELQYRMTPLPELCRQTANGRKGVIGKLFQNLASELDSQISPDVCCCLAANNTYNIFIVPIFRCETLIIEDTESQS